MDSSKKYDNPSPEQSANIISRIFFCWVLPFMKYGYQNDLEVKDIYNAARCDLSEPLGNELEEHWNEELISAGKGKKASLTRAIRKTFIKPYSFFGIMIFLQSIIIKMLQPIVLAEYIKYFRPINSSLEETNITVTTNNTVSIDNLTITGYSYEMGWILGVSVILLAFVNVVVMHYTNLGVQRIGMRCRIACCSLIYRKLLRLNRTSVGETAIGQVVNLLSNDVQRFDMAPVFLHYIWVMPIQTVIAAYIMYQSVGLAAIAGLLAITIQSVPVQGYFSRLMGIYRFKIAKRTDQRVKLMNEITSGIQVIKMYAWEKPFEKIVALSRKLEIDFILKTSYIRGVSLALMVFTERATLYLTLITFVLMGNKLDAHIVFSMAQLFNTIQLYMAIFFPMAITFLAEAKVSIRRIEEFLNKEEKSELVSISEKGEEKAGYIKITKVKATWIPNMIVDTLIDINLEIKPGTLCCVVGSVGSGKSSLLQLLLKELMIRQGKCEINGEISYASQEPWLFVSNVRNNILFGQNFDKNRYKEVIKVCALERDFELFPFGDKTLVGERGVSLSGGQRARINLARSVYQKADIYLFDDPLSAVDTHVGKHLFEQCIKNYLQDKTRILVTHQVQFLKQADLIVVLNNGKIEKISTYNELNENDLTELSTETPTEEEKPQLTRMTSVTSATNSIENEDEEPQETEELIEKGALSSSLYVEYYKNGAGILLLLLLLLLLILAQMACNAGDLWVTHWTEVEEIRDQQNKEFFHRSYNNETITTVEPFVFENDQLPSQNHYIYIYTGLIVLSIVLTTLRSLMFFKISMNASVGLHNKMFANILEAPMRFFDTNPSGRILNRFSKDMGAIDELLPRATLEALQVFLVMTGILVMVFIVTPWMIIPAIILGGLFFWFRIVYLSTAQDIKRLEGVTRAPVFSHASASLNGLPTIRASKAQKMIIREFDNLQDQHTGTWILFLATSETFGFYLDLMSTLFLTLVTLQFLVFDSSSTFNGNVGLVISQSLILTGMLQFGVRQSAEVASHMTSVERVVQYTKLDKEGPFESLPGRKPKPNWPDKGRIVFKNVYLKYILDEPPILKNLNIEILPGEKVGIVGRTGAGKSSLISSLFRLAPIEGLIEIDGIDILTIGLNDLRSNISIIPQEPVLFSASVRYNLDPFERSTDETLWKALDNVELRTAIDSLEQRVTEGGSNFSAGQRQLVCLARAIVRNNKVLVMDEATANVDPQTDNLIQKAIRNEFRHCTVLTIAHRLNTVMDSDKVLVMDAGQAMEFDHPHKLLQDPNGYFTKMVNDTGNSMSETLKAIAKEAFENKISNSE